MKKMKKYVCTALLLTAPLLICGQTGFQEHIKRVSPPPIRETEKYGKDRNHELEYMDDYCFNMERDGAHTVNGEYIGPWPIGIDLYSFEEELMPPKNEHGEYVPFKVWGIGPEQGYLTVKTNPYKLMREHGMRYVINGGYVLHFWDYTTDKEVELLTLEEVRAQYKPKVKGRVLYMINKFFITKDVEDYKLDKSFIWSVEAYPSDYLYCIKDLFKEPFTIIRIFTKTHHNWYMTRVGTCNDGRPIR